MDGNGDIIETFDFQPIATKSGVSLIKPTTNAHEEDDDEDKLNGMMMKKLRDKETWIFLRRCLVALLRTLCLKLLLILGQTMMLHR